MHLSFEFFFDAKHHTCRCEFTNGAESEPDGFLTMEERDIQNFSLPRNSNYMEKERFQHKYLLFVSYET